MTGTRLDLAPAKSTPKIYSVPFTVTDLLNRADYAGGLPLFTPGAGDVVAFAWVQVTTSFDVVGQVNVQDAGSLVNTEIATNDPPTSVLVVAEGTEVRLYGGVNTATTGAGVLHVLVFPVGA